MIDASITRTALTETKNTITKKSAPDPGAFIVTVRGVGKYDRPVDKLKKNSPWRVHLVFVEPRDGKKQILSVPKENVRSVSSFTDLEKIIKELQTKTSDTPTLLPKNNINRILLSDNGREKIGILGRELYARLTQGVETEHYKSLYEIVIDRIAGEIIARYVRNARPVPTNLLACFQNLRSGIKHVMDGNAESPLSVKDFYRFIKSPPAEIGVRVEQSATRQNGATPPSTTPGPNGLPSSRPPTSPIASAESERQEAVAANPRRPLSELLAELRARANEPKPQFGQPGWRYSNPQYYLHREEKTGEQPKDPMNLVNKSPNAELIPKI